MKRFVLLLLMSLLMASSCGNEPKPAEGEGATSEILVFAASSLIKPMEDIAKRYESTNGGIDIVLNFDSSGRIRTQVQRGANPDIFISANSKHVQQLASKDLVREESVKDWLTNSIVLVVKNDIEIEDGFDEKQLGEDRFKQIAMADPDVAPLGEYTKEILRHGKLLEFLRSKMVYPKDAKQALQYIETGNVDAAFLYATDASNLKSSRIVKTFSHEMHSDIAYQLALTRKHPSTDVQGFYEYLFSDDAKEVLMLHNFEMLVP